MAFRKFIKDNLPIFLIILTLFLYLGTKAFDKTGWDGWGFGSAQTLMSGEYWAKDGFVKNYFLFIPRPYSKLIKYFDESGFRNRPIETLNGELARDRRLYYTHYPPLYLFPYTIMAKISFESRTAFRAFSLLISLSALFLFYLFIKAISNKTIAAIASVYYGFSVTFLNYADSVSIQPWTILFTFLILYLSVLARYHYLLIWIAYLALSLSSYDATFFVFAWLVLYDAIVLKKFLWRKWFFFASAPLLGFTLQIFQNIWYLGIAGAWRDIYGSYLGRAVGPLKGFVLGLIAPFVSMTGIKTFYIFKKTFLALGGAILVFAILKYFHNCNYESRIKFQINNNFFKIIFMLAIAAVIQPFFINVTGHWPYQGVLAAPFWGLLTGVASVFLLQYIAVLKYLKEKTWFIILFLVIFGLWSVRFYDTLEYVKDWPNNKPNQKVLEFSKVIKNIEPNNERLAFRIIPQNPIWKSQFPTFNMEYYMGMPTIDFANTKDLMVDFYWFQNRSEYPFYSFIIAENKSDALKIRQELLVKNVKNISPILEIQGQYLFTVGPN